MDWLQFFSSIIGSLAWPSAVIGLTWMMRNPLSKLLPLIRTLKYKDWQIDIGEQLEAVREQVATESETPSAASEEPPLSFKSLAQADPRSAVLSAWIPVETELNEISRKLGLDSSSALIQIDKLQSKGVLNPVTFDALHKLRRIRNAAIHVTNQGVTFEDAINMAEICHWALIQLRQINSNL